MPKSRHNTTKRGTQKQRWASHEAYLEQNYPEYVERRTKAEYDRAKALAAPAMTGLGGPKPTEKVMADGTAYDIMPNGSYRRQRQLPRLLAVP